MTYLERLRQQDEKKEIQGGGVLTKPTKPPSVGFVGGAPPPVGNFASAEVPEAAPRASARKVREVVQGAAILADFREALALGRLHICANCERFSFASEPAEIGNCRQHGQVWPFVPFQCPDFTLSARPAAPAYSPASPFVLDTPEELHR